jgi:hypothetical protein
MFNEQQGFGFISSPEFPDNIFTLTQGHMAALEFPSAGDSLANSDSTPSRARTLKPQPSH